MGSLFPSFSTIIASSTTDIGVLGAYLLPALVGLAFTVVVVIAAVRYFRRAALRVVKGSTGTGGGRRMRRGR